MRRDLLCPWRRALGGSTLSGVVLLAAATAVGCGATPPPPPRRAVAVPQPKKVDAPPMAVDGEIGGLNEEAVQRAFASLAVQGCVDQRSSRLPFIGGDFKLKLRINRDGAAQWAYLSESTLGDRETERCLIGLALAKSWPKPLGGDGIAESAFSIAPRKPPALLDETRLERDVARARNEVRKCRRGARGSFAVTLYVQPSGRIAAAGVAPPDEAGESAADCMADALRELQFRYGPFKPRLAKLSFQIP